MKRAASKRIAPTDPLSVRKRKEHGRATKEGIQKARKIKKGVLKAASKARGKTKGEVASEIFGEVADATAQGPERGAPPPASPSASAGAKEQRPPKAGSIASAFDRARRAERT